MVRSLVIFAASVEFVSATVFVHLWKRQMLLSIAAGTLCYMLLVQFVF